MPTATSIQLKCAPRNWYVFVRAFQRYLQIVAPDMEHPTYLVAWLLMSDIFHHTNHEN